MGEGADGNKYEMSQRRARILSAGCRCQRALPEILLSYFYVYPFKCRLCRRIVSDFSNGAFDMSGSRKTVENTIAWK